MIKNLNENKPKILVVDIENAANLAYVWQLKTEYVHESMVEFPWYTLCWAAKWLGEKKIMSSALINFPKEYKKDQENDKMVLKNVWKLLNEADIIVGHNVDHFDRRKLNARFIMNDILPPKPYRIVDTLKIARKEFMFTSNKLNDLAKYLKLGSKVSTGGFDLWRNCIYGDKKAWRTMIKYNKQDVVLSEKVYLKMLPYIQNHPNIGNYIEDENPHCRNCGSTNLRREGYAYTNVAKYQQYSCKDCGSWSRGRKNLKENKVTVT